MIKKLLILGLVFIISLTTFLVTYTWIPIIWLVEGAVVIFFGLIIKKIYIEKAGWSVFALGLICFFITDWLRNLRYVDKDFVYQYTIINVISILIILANLIANKKSATPGTSITWKYTTIFKRITIISIWFYMLQTSTDIYSIKADRGFYYEFFKIILMIIINMAFLFFILRGPLIYDKVLRIFSYLCGFCGTSMCLWLDIFEPIIPHFEELYGKMYIAIGLLIFVNLICIISIREIYMSIKKNRKI